MDTKIKQKAVVPISMGSGIILAALAFSVYKSPYRAYTIGIVGVGAVLYGIYLNRD